MRQIDKTGQKIIKQTVPIHGPIFSLPPRIPVTVIVIKIERTMPLSVFQISPSTIYEKKTQCEIRAQSNSRDTTIPLTLPGRSSRFRENYLPIRSAREYRGLQMARRATTRRRVQIRVRRWARGDARGSAHAASYRRAAHAWSTRRGRRRMSHRVHVARLVRGVRFEFK